MYIFLRDQYNVCSCSTSLCRFHRTGLCRWIQFKSISKFLNQKSLLWHIIGNENMLPGFLETMENLQRNCWSKLLWLQKLSFFRELDRATKSFLQHLLLLNSTHWNSSHASWTERTLEQKKLACAHTGLLCCLSPRIPYRLKTTVLPCSWPTLQLQSGPLF